MRRGYQIRIECNLGIASALRTPPRLNTREAKRVELQGTVAEPIVFVFGHRLRIESLWHSVRLRICLHCLLPP